MVNNRHSETYIPGSDGQTGGVSGRPSELGEGISGSTTHSFTHRRGQDAGFGIWVGILLPELEAFFIMY